MAKRASIFKSVVFPEGSDDAGYRPVGARPIASRQDDGPAPVPTPAVRQCPTPGSPWPRLGAAFNDWRDRRGDRDSKLPAVAGGEGESLAPRGHILLSDPGPAR